jgi:hypothetical protein
MTVGELKLFLSDKNDSTKVLLGVPPDFDSGIDPEGIQFFIPAKFELAEWRDVPPFVKIVRQNPNDPVPRADR